MVRKILTDKSMVCAAFTPKSVYNTPVQVIEDSPQMSNKMSAFYIKRPKARMTTTYDRVVNVIGRKGLAMVDNGAISNRLLEKAVQKVVDNVSAEIVESNRLDPEFSMVDTPDFADDYSDFADDYIRFYEAQQAEEELEAETEEAVSPMTPVAPGTPGTPATPATAATAATQHSPFRDHRHNHSHNHTPRGSPMTPQQRADAQVKYAWSGVKSRGQRSEAENRRIEVEPIRTPPR